MAENTEMQASQKKWWKGKLAWLKNKYLLALAVFVVWMLFFDPRDIGNVISKQAKYNELRESEQQLQQQIDETKKELAQLKKSAQTIEKYAREKYLMKKDSEDLFLVAEEKKAE